MASASSSGCHTKHAVWHINTKFGDTNVRCNQLLHRRATGRCRRDGLGGDTCTRCGMVLVDARGGGTNRRAMGREIWQKAGRAGCPPCNAETGCCRVVCRRAIHGGARSDRFRPVCCQTLGRTDRRCRPHTLVLTIDPKPTQVFPLPSTTRFTNRPGTAISFITALPSNSAITTGSAFATARSASASRPAAPSNR
jgi:hypothetical protein